MTESSNQTAVEQWNITTLKAYLEQSIKCLEEKTQLEFTSRDTALRLQFDADQEHFANLNHEAARILKATEITVSRDTWDAFLTTDKLWKASVDRLLQDSVTKHEFQTYKETTDKELTLKTGSTQVINRALTFIAAGASLALIVSLLWPLVKH